MSTTGNTNEAKRKFDQVDRESDSSEDEDEESLFLPQGKYKISCCLSDVYIPLSYLSQPEKY